MKKLNIYLVLVLISLGKVFSQSDLKVLTFNTPQGVFIQVGGKWDAFAQITIERKSTGFEQIAVLKRPASKSELLENIKKAAELFGEHAPKPVEVDRVWADFQSGNRQILEQIRALPQLSYVFGFSYLDQKVASGNPVTYRVSVAGNQKTVETTYQKSQWKGDIIVQKSEATGKRIAIWLGTQSAFSYLLKFETFRKPVSSAEFVKISPLVAYNDSEKAFVLIDTSLNFNGIYQYKIKASDIFGNRYPEELQLKADNIPANLSFTITKFEAKNLPDVREVNLTWEIANSDLIQSVSLYKSNELDGNYKRLASFSPKENTRTDGIEIANELNFYRFDILDIFGRTHQSIAFKQVYDLDLPAAPVGNFAIENRGNLPLLKITPADNHTRGFYVYRKTGENGQFIQVSDLLLSRGPITEFLDSSAAFETGTLYYVVKAENDTYQKSENSEELSFSEHRVLSEKTDLEPPFDISIRYENKIPLIFWENMNARNASIVAYNVYRKGANDKEYTLINKNPLDFTQNYYSDTLMPNDVQYFYAIESVDIQGNKSIKSQAQLLDLRFEGRLLPQEAGYETSGTTIKLNWTEISSPIAKEVRIYRSENNGKPALLGKTEPTKQTFTDTKVSRGKTYRYQLGVADVSGREELFSDIFIINF